VVSPRLRYASMLSTSIGNALQQHCLRRPKDVHGCAGAPHFIFSLLISWRSGKRAARALAISESQEQRREPRLGTYLVRGYRRREANGQLFGFLVSITNPTDSNNSIGWSLAGKHKGTTNDKP